MRRGRSRTADAGRIGSRRSPPVIVPDGEVCLDRCRPAAIRSSWSTSPSSIGFSKPDRRDDRQRHVAGADVGGEQLVRDRLAEHLVDVPQVPAEQVVELEVVVRRMVVAVPPEPVAAFGDQQLLARLLSRFDGLGARPARRVRTPGARRASWLQARWSSAWPIQM